MSFAEVAERKFFTPVPGSSSHLKGQRTWSSHLPEVFGDMLELIFAIVFSQPGVCKAEIDLEMHSG